MSQQYGDFIRGRLLFIEQYCAEHKMEFDSVIRNIEEEARRRIDADEGKQLVLRQFFEGAGGADTTIPSWVDRVFLEATSQILKGCQSPLYTTTSRLPCIPFEAARFNAIRQAETIFKPMFTGRQPADWIKWSFPAVYRKCYGEAAAKKLKIVEFTPRHFGVITDNTGLEKASRIDCSTVIGYICGALEQLGAGEITITHKSCLAEAPSGQKICTFDAMFEFPARHSDPFRKQLR